jgi:two-component sensor histidine kinase
MTENDGAERITELEADNRRLRRLLDQQDAPGELRHRLHSTLAMLRIIIRKSAETKRDLESYVAHLEDRLEALARAQAAADVRGAVDLHALLSDELLHYGATEGDRFVLSGPAVHLQPRAGQVLALAVHELAVNAVEHGALGTRTGRVEVTWSVADEADMPFTLTWKERGPTRSAEGSRQGFGMEVLTRTLAYELRATTAFDFDGDGLRCTIRFPLTERVGRLRDE